MRRCSIVQDVHVCTEAAIHRCSSKKIFLKISQKSRKDTCARVSFFNKETLTRVFSCEFDEIFKNTFLTEQLWVTASICTYH